MLRPSLSLTLLMIALATGCGRPATPPTIVDSPRPARNQKIPVEVSYPILQDEDLDRVAGRRRVTVRLNMKVPDEVLREISMEVKATEKRQYERTFIDYFLPEEVYGAPEKAWALAMFNPTYSLKINGLTVEHERELRSLPMASGPRVLGTWLLDPYQIMVTVDETTGRPMLYERSWGSNQPFPYELTEISSVSGRRFKKAGSTEQIEIDQGGVLRMYDQDGKVFTAARPIGSKLPFLDKNPAT